MPSDAEIELGRLSEAFFEAQNHSDPLSATLLGIPGYDGLLPDLTRDGSQRAASLFAELDGQLERLDRGSLEERSATNYDVLRQLNSAARSDLEHGLWEANVSAEGYAAPQSMVFMCVPAAVIADAESADNYLSRLAGLPSLFDAIGERLAQAAGDGRRSTATGISQALAQLDGHLTAPLGQDVLANPTVSGRLDADGVRAKARDLVRQAVRPALQRLAERMRGELLPTARGDDEVGIGFVPGGESGYRAAVRRHTTTNLSPAEIHGIGLERLEQLRAEWSVLGRSVLGTSELGEILLRLREDTSLRFHDASQIVDVVRHALERAEGARDHWFPPYQIADCVIEEINPIEAGNAALAHYRPPAADGSRPGAHCVLTTEPEQRFVYEYEALAFHESTPGHHLQIASAQTLSGLPTYRRFLDAQVCAYVEGWGLYAERLADEMGLYTSDVARLGMLSFESLRACRLVVDTGMHHYGWSRQRAAEFMWEHTATTRANVRNEINRYIGWPGQALAYMVGSREIRRLRERAETRLGDSFDVKAFHGVVLGEGAVPLAVLAQLVDRWVDKTAD